jgi:hypothetical protein
MCVKLVKCHFCCLLLCVSIPAMLHRHSELLMGVKWVSLFLFLETSIPTRCIWRKPSAFSASWASRVIELFLAWSFLHHHAYLHHHFSFVILYTNENSECGIALEGFILFPWQSEELACMSHTASFISQKIGLFPFHLPLHTIHLISLTHFLFALSMHQAINQRSVSFQKKISLLFSFHLVSHTIPLVCTSLSSLSLSTPSTRSKVVFLPKQPVFSSKKLWAWSFLHHHTYLYCHFSSFPLYTNEIVSVTSL